MIKEIIYLAIIFSAIAIVYKIVTKELQDRRENRQIDKVLKDPKLLLSKLKNPEIRIGGEMVQINKIVDDGEVIKIEGNEANPEPQEPEEIRDMGFRARMKRGFRKTFYKTQKIKPIVLEGPIKITRTKIEVPKEPKQNKKDEKPMKGKVKGKSEKKKKT